MKSVRLFLWFLVGVALSSFTVLSFAGERYPTSSDGRSGEDFCKAFVPHPSEAITMVGSCYKDDGCPFDQNGGVCNHRYSINYTWASGSGKKSFDGLWGYCDTATPFRFNGACYAKPPCELKANKFHNNGMFGDSNLVGGDGAFSGDTTDSKFPDNFCIESCQASTDNLEGMGSGSTWYGFGNPKFTGASCDRTSTSEKEEAEKIPPTTPEYDCVKAGKGYGTFNGTVICTEALKQQENQTSTKTETKTDGSKTETKTDSQVKCDGTTCTTTTTTTTTEFSSTGSQTSQSQSSTSDSKPDPAAGSGTGVKGSGDFCAENPASSMCQKGTFGGDCGSVPSCSGDAVQCATAKAVFETKCALVPAKDILENGAVALTGGDDATKDALKRTDVDVTLGDSSGSGGGGCPGDRSFSVGGQNISIPFSQLCGGMEIMRLALLAVASFTAVFIVLGGVK